MNDSNINDFDEEEKKTESENESSENIRLQKKTKLISALITFDNVIKQISNIDQQSSAHLIKITNEWKKNIRSKYEITEKDIQNVKQSKKDTRKEDLKNMEKKIEELRNEVKELKSNEKAVQLLQYFKNLKDNIGNPVYSKFDEKGLPTHDSKGEKITQKKRKQLSEKQKQNYKQNYEQKLTEINDKINNLTVKKSIVQYASETASIGKILTGKLVKFVDEQNIKTLKDWKDAVKNGKLKEIRGIGERKARVLNNIRIVLETQKKKAKNQKKKTKTKTKKK